MVGLKAWIRTMQVRVLLGSVIGRTLNCVCTLADCSPPTVATQDRNTPHLWHPPTVAPRQCALAIWTMET